MDGPIRVCIVNDYEIIVEGLRAMLAPFGDRVVVVETEVGGMPHEQVDLVLFDTFASRRHSLERVGAIADDPRSRHLVLYTWDAPQAFLDDVDHVGVDAVIPKRLCGEELVRTMEQVAAGQRVDVDLRGDRACMPLLSEREREVLALIARGKSNPEIAGELYLSVDTVKTHARTMFRKLGVTNRTQAALAARRFGLDQAAAS